jgi:translation initiation factor 2B subunit (eIF-2B alpha/beta/delta family)
MKKQMRSEAVQTIDDTVKKSKSVFVKQFMEIEKEVDEQLELATETKRSLHKLHRFLEQVDTVSEGLDALQEKFKSILHLLYLMYKRTRWYHRPRHICSVVRRVTDFLANQFITPIDGTSIFGDM